MLSLAQSNIESGMYLLDFILYVALQYKIEFIPYKKYNQRGNFLLFPNIRVTS